MPSYLLQILLWLVYGALHSVLADNKVKQLFEQKMGKGYRWYRLLYNLLALLFLVGILAYQRTLPADGLWEFDWARHMAGNILKYGGLLLVLMAVSGYDLREFSGLALSPRNADAGSGTLKTTRLLRYVRHPIYTGTLLFVWGLFVEEVSVRNLIMAVCVTAYVRIGIVFEERKLVAEFGESYLEYRRRVPMLFPNLYKAR
ncbi:MAG: isoprenylcysteine carboxylmethyltransferase family protein [Spirosomataceae bacterium]